MEWDLIWELVTQTGQVPGLEMAVRASWELTIISLPWVSEDGLQGFGTYMFTLLF